MFYRPGVDEHGLPHDPFKALVTPRPIGWISTRANGHDNLAPYSFFNGCGDHPPLVMFSQTGRKSRGTRFKDSISNIRESGVFACNIVSHALRDAMNTSSGSWEDADEFELAGLEKGQCREIDAPFVAAAPAVLECRVVRILDDLPSDRDHASNVMVIGQVVGVHVRDEVIDGGRVDVLRFNPVARLGYMDYATVTELWQMDRPQGDAK